MNGFHGNLPLKLLLLVLLFSPSVVIAQSQALPEGTIQVPGGTGTWVDARPPLPAGTKMLLLEGHPAKEGFFTMRLKLQAGGRLQPHWHPREERVTILSGLARVGFGDSFVEKEMTTFGPGSFYVNPPKSHHYVWIVEDTEMQLTGIGPWELHLLEHE
jgi:quercetin dioxygenase-like cupin family protein